MRIFKYMFVVLSAIILLNSCSDNDDEANITNAEISLSSEIIQMTKDGGSETITVTSSGDWQLSGLADWVHPSATSGKDGDVVTFTIDPTSSDKVQSTTFKFFTGSSVAPLKIEIQPAYVLELKSSDNMALSKDEQTFNIELNTNIAEPDIQYSDGGEEWITFEKSMNFINVNTLIFKANSNTTYKDRTSNVIISSPLASTPITVKVSQAQTDALIVQDTQLSYDLKERSITFTLQYNVDYTISVTKGNDWITKGAVSAPQTNSDGLSSVNVTLHLGKAGSSRVGTVHIEGKDGSVSQNITISQKDPNAKYISIPDDGLRTLLNDKGWILSLSANENLVLESGLKGTEFVNSSWDIYIADLTGIEYFPNLTKLGLGSCRDMERLDISGLHKVKELTFSDTGRCSEYNLGDNPISKISTGQWTIIDVSSLKFIANKVETMDLSTNRYWSSSDQVTSIDVSECPALKTLNVKRSDKLKTLILKKGQEIPNLIKEDYTQIVYK